LTGAAPAAGPRRLAAAALAAALAGTAAPVAVAADRVFVQCAAVQGNGYNWAATLGWLSAQVELAAARAAAYEAAEPGRRAALDIACLTGSSSGSFVAAVYDRLLSNPALVSGEAGPGLATAAEARGVADALLFLALSTDFRGEGFGFLLSGIAARLGLAERGDDAAGTRMWRGGTTAGRNLRTVGRWVLAAERYEPDWFEALLTEVGPLPALDRRPMDAGPAGDGATLKAHTRRARSILDARVRGASVTWRPVSEGFCATALTVPAPPGLAPPFDLGGLRLVHACAPATAAALAASPALAAAAGPETARRMVLAAAPDWRRLVSMSVREPGLVTPLSGPLTGPPIGLDGAVAFGGAPADPGPVLVLGGFAGPRLQAWSAAATLLGRLAAHRAAGREADGRLAVFGRTEFPDDPTATFAQRTMVRFFADDPAPAGVPSALAAYEAWDGELCAALDALGPEIRADFYRMDWNVAAQPGAFVRLGHVLAAKGFNLVRVQTPRARYPELGPAFFDRYLADARDGEATVPSPPPAGMACRLQERGI
jgi:hypothetical protein